MKYRIFLYMLLLGPIPIQVGAQVEPLDPFIIRNNLHRYHLDKGMAILSDPQNQLSIDQVCSPEVQAKFQPYSARPRKLASQSTYWIKIHLAYHLDYSQEWILHTPVQLDEMEVFLPQANGSYVSWAKAGLQVPNSQQNMVMGPPLQLKLRLEEKSNYIIYVRLKNQYRYPAIHYENLYLEPLNHWYAHFYPAMLLRVFLLGSLGIMLLFHLLFFAISGDRPYLYYASYIAFILVYYANQSDFISDLMFPERSLRHYLTLSLLVAPLFYLAFIRRFLKTKRDFPKIDKGILGLMLIGLLLFALAVGAFYEQNMVWVRGITALYNLIQVLFAIVGSFLFYRKGNELVHYFIFANAFWVAGILGLLILNSYLPPQQAHLPLLIGATLELAIFSLGLGHRNLLNEEERLEAQQAFIQQLEENEKLQIDINQRLEEQVIQRTKELTETNEELLASEEEIRQNMDELHTTQEALEQKNRALIHQNTQISQSLNYAGNIQKALLPTEEDLNGLFKEHFVLYKPREIVSGDFYWLSRHKDKIILAVVDCTGHGVPGAFMSMIGNTLLNEIINEKKVTDPAWILELLHVGIIKGLRQKESGNNDGMDIGICVLEKLSDVHTKLVYAGAKNELLLHRFQTGELTRIKGDRLSIGGYFHSLNRSFSNREMILESGDLLYLSSDGLRDNPNPQRKKFGQKRFKEFILEHHHQSLERQKTELIVKILEFQQNAEQRDDMLVVGIRL